MVSDGDRSKDDQIAMSEYSGQWSAKTLASITSDKNRDGLVTVEEVMAATKPVLYEGLVD